jgi:AcrR family transcriptional regulator
MLTLGLRERKRRDTRRAIAGAAQELVLEHGLDAVTIDQIANAADVSPRTFFNYFASKDEALVGIDDASAAELGDELRDRPPHEGPAEALRNVLLVDADTDPAGILRRWRLRNELVRRHPTLVPRYLEAAVKVEDALAGALADRLGVDPARDPYPRAMAVTALGLVRSTLAWWWEHGNGEELLLDALHRTFDAVLPSRAAP